MKVSCGKLAWEALLFSSYHASMGGAHDKLITAASLDFLK